MMLLPFGGKKETKAVTCRPVDSDPYNYRVPKAKGGMLANYPNETSQSLTEEQIKRHLLGEQLIGLNSLLTK
jgi:hypothetical protein